MQGFSGTDQKMETDDFGNFHPKLLEMLFRAAETSMKKTFLTEWKWKANPISIVIVGDIFNLLFSDL